MAQTNHQTSESGKTSMRMDFSWKRSARRPDKRSRGPHTNPGRQSRRGMGSGHPAKSAFVAEPFSLCQIAHAETISGWFSRHILHSVLIRRSALLIDSAAGSEWYCAQAYENLDCSCWRFAVFFGDGRADS